MLTYLSVTNSDAEITYGLLLMLLFSSFSFLWLPQVPVTKEGPPKSEGTSQLWTNQFNQGRGIPGSYVPPSWMAHAQDSPSLWSCPTLQLPWPPISVDAGEFCLGMERGSKAGHFLGVLPRGAAWQETQKMRTVFEERLDFGGRDMTCGWSRQAKVTQQVLSVGFDTLQSYKNQKLTKPLRLLHLPIHGHIS